MQFKQFTDWMNDFDFSCLSTGSQPKECVPPGIREKSQGVFVIFISLRFRVIFLVKMQ